MPFSRILNPIQSYTELPPLQKVFCEGMECDGFDGLKRMSLDFEMLLQNEIRGCNFQNIAIHSSLSLLYLRLIEEY